MKIRLVDVGNGVRSRIGVVGNGPSSDASVGRRYARVGFVAVERR
jgi:hypothetical protein